ncbi:MAG TPA: Lrp/AsnC ligand binding domain-containing protein [Candidatus Acidoferrales bacterium]|nr:Lrp/AsnC ligand binding domain-containing protein [Candidatus Acidoferrales bacterium]
MRAYVLVTVGPGKARDIAKKIGALSGVKMANACWGDPDVYVVAEVNSTEDLNSLVMSKIQSIEGVGRTSTHIAID